MDRKRLQAGQMLLVVVLTMIVALTVGLSIASRTITSLKISKQSEESQRAFQAAEAGVEQILQSGAELSNLNLSNNASYTTAASYPSGTSFFLNGGELVDQGAGIDVWLSEYPDFRDPVSAANVTIYWGTDNQTSCTNTGGAEGPTSVRSALEIVLLSGNKLSPTSTKYIIEGGGCTRISGATAAQVGGTVAPINFQYSTQFSVTNGLIMRVIPIFNSSKIAIVSNVSLPRQGTIVESVGKSGETARKVEYFSSYPQIPLEVFPYSLIMQ